MTNDDPEPFAFMTEDHHDLDAMSDVEILGRFVWELTGRSAKRLVAAFLMVLIGSALPTVLLIVWLFSSNAAATRGFMGVFAAVVLVLIAAFFALNYVVYSGLRDVVHRIGIGARLGAAFAAKLDDQGLDHIPVADFSDRLRRFLTGEAAKSKPQKGGLRSWIVRTALGVLFFGVRVVLNRIARGCVVDGKVDMVAFAEGIGEQTDKMVVRYFQTLLWDLMRVIVVVVLLLLWLVMTVISAVI